MSAFRAGTGFVDLTLNDSPFAKAAGKLRGLMGGMARMATRVLAPLAGIFSVGGAIAAVKVWGDFEQQMAAVSTMLVNPAAHMADFTQGVREMAVRFGESTDSLAGGLYDILSASVNPAKALDVLTTSAMAAKAGLSNTQTAADAITTVMNAYGMSAEKAGDISDWLFTVVARGKTTFGELAPQIGKVATLAASAGVPLEDMGALLATMTRNGLSTEASITGVQGIIQGFIKPSTEAADAARALGIELSGAALKNEGLPAIMAKLSKLDPDTLAKLFPSVEGLRGLLPALKNMAGFAEDRQAMTDRAGATETAYEKMAKGIKFQFGRVKQMVMAAMGRIGEVIANELDVSGMIQNMIGLYQRYSDSVVRVVGTIMHWIGQNKSLIATVAGIGAGIVAAVGAGLAAFAVISGAVSLFGLVITGVTAAVGALGAVIGFIASPIGLAVVAVAGLATWLGYLVSQNETVRSAFSSAFGEIKEIVGDTFGGIVDALKAGDIGLAGKIAMAGLKSAVFGALSSLLESFQKFGTGVVTGMNLAFSFVAERAVSGATAVLNAWVRVRSWFATLWTGIKQDAAGAFSVLQSWGSKAALAVAEARLDPETFRMFRDNLGDPDQRLREDIATQSATADAERAQIEQDRDADLDRIKTGADVALAGIKTGIDGVTNKLTNTLQGMKTVADAAAADSRAKLGVLTADAANTRAMDEFVAGGGWDTSEWADAVTADAADAADDAAGTGVASAGKQAGGIMSAGEIAKQLQMAALKDANDPGMKQVELQKALVKNSEQQTQTLAKIEKKPTGGPATFGGA